MNQSFVHYSIAGLLSLLIACPSWGQKSGASQPSAPSRGSIPGTTGPPVGPSQPSAPPLNQTQSPLFVNGRVLMETGQPVPEPVSVELYCGMRPLQVIHTDLGGYFEFTLGAGMQSNMDFSASDATPMSLSGNPMNSPGGYRDYGASGRGLTGCELRVAVPGYQPLTYTISDPADMGKVEVGTLRLSRIAGVQGSAISVTSLQVPNNARKEFEKGEKEVRSNHLKPAAQHLEKAVAEYDKYAAAWSELGGIYFGNHETDKARQAFEKSIAADPEYIPPYVSLAALELQDQKFENALSTAGKALELDPNVGFASFIQAVADFNLNRLDAAEKTAREAAKGPHGSFPQLHALLADILMQKQDYSGAATEMRAYLKEAPRGQFAGQMKKNLEQIEKAAASGSESSSPSVPQPVAP